VCAAECHRQPALRRADIGKGAVVRRCGIWPPSRTADLIVSPYANLDAPVVATAWGRQLQLTANDPRLRQFIQAYRQGPQAPERGGPCSGGVGNPEP